MATIETIKASEAPPAPKKQSKIAAELLSALDKLGKDEVLRMTPDEGKSIRGLKTGIGRITKGNNVKVETWSDEQAVYVKKA